MKYMLLGDLIKPAQLVRAGKQSYPILSMTMHHGLVDQQDKFKKRVASNDTSQYKVVSKNQLVVGFPIDEGVLAFQTLYDLAIVSPAYDIWDILRSNETCPSYLQYFLRSSKAIDYYGAKLRGTTARRRTLPKEVFLELPVPFPEIKVQKKIAEILDKADALRQKRCLAIQKLDTLLQSVFIDMFGDPLNQKNSGEAHFGDLVKRVTYGFTSPMKHMETGIPILTAKNIKNGYIDFKNVHFADKNQFDMLTSKSKPRMGDILITKDGTIGRCSVVDVDFPICINQSVALVETDEYKVSSQYLLGYLLSPAIQSQMIGMGKGNALKHLQITELAKLPIKLPTKEEQDNYGKKRTAILNLIQKNNTAEEKAKNTFFALQHQLLNRRS